MALRERKTLELRVKIILGIGGGEMREEGIVGDSDF